MKYNIFSNKITAVFIAVAVSVLWGTLFPMIKIGYRHFEINSTDVPSIILFAGMRFLISGVILVGLNLGKGEKSTGFDIKKAKAIFIVSLLTVIVHYALTYTGLSLAEGSKSSVLKQIGFLFVPCIAFLLRKDDKFSRYKVMAALIGFIAVVTISIDGMSFSFGTGELLIVLASFSSMFGQMASKNIYDTYRPGYIVAHSQLWGGIVLVIAGLAFGGGVGSISPKSIATLAYICVASIAANLLWNTLIKYNNMSKLAVFKSMDPLFASLFSAMLLGENIMKPTYLIAIVLITVAIVISNFNPQSKCAAKCR